MSEQQATEALEGLEPLEGHQRGSADELLDAGAHAPIDAMRHSATHVMADAVLDLFPGAKLGIGAQLGGPLVVGPEASVGAGSRVMRSVLTEGAEVPDGGFAVGGVLGRGGS